jgi:arginase
LNLGQPQLLGIPHDASSSYLRGAAEAPPLIRAALFSPAGNSWTESLRDLAATGGLLDAGDLPCSDPRDCRAQIESGVAAILTAGNRPLVLGGDHSITYPVVRAVGRCHQPLTIVHIDAHPDLYDEFEGDRYSHACPFARILEEGQVSRLVQVGIRTMNSHQRGQAERFGVEVVRMREWSRGARPQVDGLVYLSVDLDGLDPAFAPGVSHREPGGLSVREVVDFIQDLGGELVGADVVEFNPRQDPSGVTATVAAKIVREIAGRMLAGIDRETPPTR